MTQSESQEDKDAGAELIKEQNDRKERKRKDTKKARKTVADKASKKA